MPTPKELREDLWEIQYIHRVRQPVPDPEKPWLRTMTLTETQPVWASYFKGLEDPLGEIVMMAGKQFAPLRRALEAIHELRQRHPEFTFRLLNVETGDFLMGDIL